MPKLIKTWEELFNLPPNDKWKIESNNDYGCSGWIVPVKETSETMEKYFDYHIYLSTHTFYGSQYKYYTRILQEHSFDVQLANWDKPKHKR